MKKKETGVINGVFKCDRCLKLLTNEELVWISKEFPPQIKSKGFSRNSFHLAIRKSVWWTTNEIGTVPDLCFECQTSFIRWYKYGAPFHNLKMFVLKSDWFQSVNFRLKLFLKVFEK